MKVVERPRIHVPLEALASAVALSPRRVQQLANLHVMKRGARGTYDLFASLTGYIVYLHDAMGKKSSMDADGNVSNTKNQLARLREIEVARAEISLARDREQVMAIDDHKRVVGTLILETRARMMTVGARAAPKVLTQKSRAAVRSVIDAEVTGALIAMSKAELAMPDAIAPPLLPAKKKPARARAKKKTARKPKRSSKTAVA